MPQASFRRTGYTGSELTVDFGRLRFLVVDDNAFMRRIVRTVLMGFGARAPQEAGDGAAAIEVVKALKPDIAIVDWEMPGLNGLDFTRAVRQLPPNGNPFMPIIMMSAHSEKQRVLAARDAGVNEFMVKPISARAVYTRVFSVVASPRPFIRAPSYLGPERRRAGAIPYAGVERRVRRHSVAAPGTGQHPA